MKDGGRREERSAEKALGRGESDATSNDVMSRKPPFTQVMVNLGIMVVGEWFVTDSIVAYCSHYWHGRYLNNIPRAWQRISRKEHWGKVLVLVAVMTSTVVFIQAPDELCYTG